MSLTDNYDHGAKGLKYVADTVAVAGLPAALLDSPHLPGVYTLLGCVWLSIRIWETKFFRAMRVRVWGALLNWLSK